MAESGILGTFASHAFLKGLRERHLMVLASGARPFAAAPGDYLAREGEAARCFYLIQSGHVSIEIKRGTRDKVRVQSIGPGEIVGWSWIVPPHRWQFDAQAQDEVSGLSFDANWLRELCDQDYELGYCLLRQLVTVIASRLAATRMQLLDTH